MAADIMCPNCGEVIDVDDEATEDYYDDYPCATCEDEADDELESLYDSDTGPEIDGGVDDEKF